MDITKDDKNLIIKIPLKARRFNPYNDEAGLNPDTGEMNNIVGVIAGDEQGFAFQIDMDYKGKENQVGDIFLKYYEDDFSKLCRKLKIDFIKYPLCAYCRKPIYGSYTSGGKGNQCWDCELKIK